MVRHESDRIGWIDVPVKDPKVGDLRCEVWRPRTSRIPLDINRLQRLDNLLYRVLQRMYRRRVLLISTRCQRLVSLLTQFRRYPRSDHPDTQPKMILGILGLCLTHNREPRDVAMPTIFCDLSGTL
jgi:hypothetical protein